MRRTIAKRLTESIGPIPHFYLTVDYDVTNLLALREQINEVEGVKTSVNDYVIRAAALALRQHPNVNASFGEEAIAQHGEIHVGVAVSTAEGLITPVVRNADQKSLTAISAEMRDLAARARAKKLKPNEYQGGASAISNLGMYGVREFSAIINPPHGTILAVGATRRAPVETGDGGAKFISQMTVTLSCDHRVVDGALGAQLLAAFKAFVEKPVTALV
jgi:pyruvate dehydrogenase E2 component (dihydrolipoamide acetyltransferase)